MPAREYRRRFASGPCREAKANLKLREWTLSSATSGELLKVPSAAYVLAGNTLTGSYPLKIQADGPLKLSVVTDRGTFSSSVSR